jgi:hypothetical protein
MIVNKNHSVVAFSFRGCGKFPRREASPRI